MANRLTGGVARPLDSFEDQNRTVKSKVAGPRVALLLNS